MGWRLAESLKTLRVQVDALWPHRDKTSDGSVGDLSHSQRKSDHNPNGAGVVTAIDIDRELSGQPDGSNAGDTVAILVAKLQASCDPRIKYLIWNGQMTVKGDISTWKLYTGPNAHKHHCHISVSSDPKLYDDARAWDLTRVVGPGECATPLPVPHTSPINDTPPAIVQMGDTGRFVREIQTALASRGFLASSGVDGSFGLETKKALINFQVSQQLHVDGKCGIVTRGRLGLK